MCVGLLSQPMVKYPALECAQILITAVGTLTGVITMQSVKVMKALHFRLGVMEMGAPGMC